MPRAKTAKKQEAVEVAPAVANGGGDAESENLPENESANAKMPAVKKSRSKKVEPAAKKEKPAAASARGKKAAAPAKEEAAPAAEPEEASQPKEAKARGRKKKETVAESAQVVKEAAPEPPKVTKRGSKGKKTAVEPEAELEAEPKPSAKPKKVTKPAAEAAELEEASSSKKGRARAPKRLLDSEIAEIMEEPNEEDEEAGPSTKKKAKKTENGLKQEAATAKRGKKKEEIEQSEKESAPPTKKRGSKKAVAQESNGLEQEEEQPKTTSKRAKKTPEPKAEPEAAKKRTKKGKVEEEERGASEELAQPVAAKKRTKKEEKENGELTTEQPPKETKPGRGRKRGAAATPAEDVEVDEGNEEADGSKTSKTKKAETTTSVAYDKADFAAPSDKEFNLKISSWNVAGLRAWLKKDGLKFLDVEEPDIFCLQETKCSNDQLPEEMVRLTGYHPYWLCMPGGYAGVAIYSKIMPINVEYGIGNEEFDDVGRMITAEYEKFYLINVYVPNSGRKLVNLEPRMRWEKLFQEYVKKLDELKPVLICGDMNVSHLEIDLANPKTNTKNAGFTKEEREKMSELLSLGFVDTFRHLYPKRTGAYTFWTYMANARARNVGWRLDYCIVSERFVSRIVDHCMRSKCLGSDHCPITVFLNV